jgi:putative ABC transport system ATP-binding protein
MHRDERKIAVELHSYGPFSGTAEESTAGVGTSPLISLQRVEKEYRNAAGRFLALDGVDLAVTSGEFVMIVGKSGCGKSTLINVITGIDRPTAGRVLVAGTDLSTLDEGAMAQWRGHMIGVVFQFFQLLPTLTAVENVMLPMDFCQKWEPAERYDRAMQLLDRVEMGDMAEKLPSVLSGGQQQSVAIARALANDPPMIVADEPTGNLDIRTAELIFHLFHGLVDKGKTILMVTHDDDLAQRGQRRVRLVDGRIIDEYRRG